MIGADQIKQTVNIEIGKRHMNRASADIEFDQWQEGSGDRTVLKQYDYMSHMRR